jgi:hypothetical protein
VGRAKGKALIHATPCGSLEKLNFPVGPNSQGRLTIGSAKQPPNASPITTPELKTSGSSRNARLWYFLSLTISAVIVRITPIFPFPIPATTRQHITAGIVVENPNPTFAIMDSVRPMTMLGFLPQ